MTGIHHHARDETMYDYALHHPTTGMQCPHCIVQSQIYYVVFKQNPVSGWISMIRDLMNQDHPLTGFCFYPVMGFFEYISSKIVYFIKNTIDYFFIVKVLGAPSQQVKCSISLPHDVTVNTHCHVTMGLWCCLGNYVTSQWIGDVAIDTK